MNEFEYKKSMLHHIATELGIPTPYSVKLETRLGGYLQFCTMESGISKGETAKHVADEYAKSAGSRTFKAVHVFKNSEIVYTINL